MVPQILQLIMAAVITGGALYLFNLMPIDARIKQIATALILIVAIVWAIKWLMGLAH